MRDNTFYGTLVTKENIWLVKLIYNAKPASENQRLVPQIRINWRKLQPETKQQGFQGVSNELFAHGYPLWRADEVAAFRST